MTKSKIILSAIFLVLVTGIVGRSATIYVFSEQGTIQAGIDSAQDGDTVLVSPGTYSGAGNTSLQVVGKQLFIVGEQGAEATVIDGEGVAFAGFGAPYGEIGPGTEIIGFTVTGARHGLAIGMLSDGVVVRDCRFINNDSCGIAVERDQPERNCNVHNCIISGNHRGLGTYAYVPDIRVPTAATADISYQFVFDSCLFDSNTIAVETFAELQNCTLTRNLTVFRLSVRPEVHVRESEISGNNGPIAVLTAESCDDVGRGSLYLYDCLIHNNQGGISHGSSLEDLFGRLHMSGCLYHHNAGRIDITPLPYAAVIRQNTFVNNVDFALRLSPPRRDSTVHELTDNIVAFNQGCGISYNHTEPRLAIACNNFFQNDGGDYCDSLGDSTGLRGNISVDPLFEDRAGPDYTLKESSPCLSLPAPCEGSKGWPAGGSPGQVPCVDTLPPAAIGDLH